jgi:signal transduction histidine kinase
VDWPRRIAAATGFYAVAAGVVTIIGWITNIQRLTDWKNDGISMFPNTAACAAMCGAALLLADTPTANARRALRFFASFAAFIAALTLFEHVSGINLGIDTLVFERSWGQGAAAAPMRMGPPAGTSFLVAGTALLMLTLGPRERRASTYLAGLVIAIGMLSLVGHIYGASQMYTLPRLTGIAMQTASVVVALGIGVLASVPEREPVRTLTQQSAAGLLTRQALPFLIVLALGLGAIRVALEKAGLVDAPFGTALRSVVDLGLLIGLLWWAAARVRTYEDALRKTEAEVRKHASQLGDLLQVAEGAREEAEAANRGKDEFLAMLAHELRNPLSAVRNAVTAATLDHASRERALQIAGRQTDQLARIVDDLLDVARITRGSVPLRKERVVLHEILRRAADGCRAQMDERRHAFTLAISDEAIQLEADGARVEQAVANILSNAAKYTDPGGTVTLSAERSGGDAVIRVHDNGIGILPSVLPRVFDLSRRGTARSTARRAASASASRWCAASSRCTVERSRRKATVRARAPSSSFGCRRCLRLMPRRRMCVRRHAVSACSIPHAC